MKGRKFSAAPAIRNLRFLNVVDSYGFFGAWPILWRVSARTSARSSARNQDRFERLAGADQFEAARRLGQRQYMRGHWPDIHAAALQQIGGLHPAVPDATAVDGVQGRALDQPVTEVDRNRARWRADQTEIATRLRVAELRAQSGAWRTALALLRELRQLFPEQGEAAAKALLSRIQNPKQKYSEHLTVSRFIPRQST